MGKEVRTVADLSGHHVGTDTVRIEYGSSIIEGIITELTVSTQRLTTRGGDRYYTARADIKIGEEFELYDIPMNAPASIVTRSQGTWHSDSR